MPRSRAISNLSLTDIQRIIEDRHHELKKLEKQRKKWQRKVDRVDAQIASLGGHVAKGGRLGGGTRVHNEVTLPEAIAEVLTAAGGPIAIVEITEKVQASGYRSNSENFRGIVNQMLIKDRRFVSESRGVYRIRGGAASSNGAGKPRRRRKSPKRAKTLAAQAPAAV